jgi:mannitol/fructose-specific phosphotransferase system IIA component (Ntr-type)
MKVSQLVPVTNISIGWPAAKIPLIKSARVDNKWELIRGAVTFLCEQAEIPDDVCEVAIQLVSDREKSMTTAIGHGIAIPHASIANIKKPIAVCVILAEGIEFEAIDYEPVQIVILALLPEKDYKKHILTLSGIVDLTSHPEIKEKLLQAKTPENAWQEICNLEKTLVSV